MHLSPNIEMSLGQRLEVGQRADVLEHVCMFVLIVFAPIAQVQLSKCIAVTEVAAIASV